MSAGMARPPHPAAEFVRPLWDNPVMFETTPPTPASELIDPAELDDPVAAVVAVELENRFIRLCLCQSQRTVARLARNEATLRRPGGIDLEKRSVALRLYRGIEADVFELMSRSVPLSRAEFALSRMEIMLREQFADVVGTAASYLLSDGRDAAIQMASVAITMAAREVRSRVLGIIGQTRDEDCEA